MKTERLRKWLRQRPAGGTRVSLSVEVDGKIAEELTARSAVEIEEGLRDGGDEDPTEDLLAVAQDWTDDEGSPQRFVFRWHGTRDNPLKTVSHRARPTGHTAPLEPLTNDTVLRTFLAHIEKSNDALLKSHTTLQKAASELVDVLRKELRETRGQDAVAPSAELSNEEREEALQRAGAWKALAAKLPDVFDLAIAAAAEKLLPDKPKEKGKPDLKPVDGGKSE